MAGLIATVFDALFPRFCVRCRREGELCCAYCLQKYPLTPPETVEDHRAAFAYGNPLVRDVLKAWKYDFDFSGWDFLRQHAAHVLPRLKEMIGQNSCAIVPLPLSKQRFCERGFNQSEAIAQWLGSELHLPVVNALDRHHSATHQAMRSTAERVSAMKSSEFLLKGKDSFLHVETILLVDDVFTTGATLAAAKEILKGSGVTRILSFTLAKS